jgi:hypothetical protein
LNRKSIGGNDQNYLVTPDFIFEKRKIRH